MPRSIALTKRDKSVKFVINTIALMYEEGKEYILLQENKNQYGNNNIFELPGVAISEGEGENVYSSLRCELDSKGFEITKIFGEDKCNAISEVEDTVTIFKPFCVSQSFTDSNTTISSTILCEVDSAKVKKNRYKSGFRWISIEYLKAMLVDYTENISAHNIAALKLFCEA